MKSIPFLSDTADRPLAVLLLAHGAGLGMDSPFLTDMAARIAANGVTVLRFEFPYMAGRRSGGSRRPPPRADKLCDFYCEAISQARGQWGSKVPFLIGGKSLGGRVASMIADTAFASGAVQGLVCVGYPFHPPRKPDSLRTAHLGELACPALFCQGTRDQLGGQNEVAGYGLADCIRMAWIEDGDHDLVPRKRSGRTAEDNRQDAADAVAVFAASLS